MGTRTRPALLAAIVSATVTSVVVGGIVVAAIPDATGTIHACYKKSGQLRVIDTATEACSGSETPLSWNQRGPAGPPGSPTSSPHIIGGQDILGMGGRFAHVPLFGGGLRWTRLTMGGTLADFGAMLPVLPGSVIEEHRHEDATVTFTVMCMRPGGPASSCNGLGPGPSETPVSCTMRHLDYVDQPRNTLPFCTDTAGAQSFEFDEGDWITVFIERSANATGGTSGWTASFTPAP